MRLLTLATLLLLPAVSAAAVVEIHDTAGLVQAIANAGAGDVLVLANGTYRLQGARCTANGTESAPITVRGAKPLGAVIEFDGLEGFKVSGSHWHFEGLDIVGVCANHSDCEHAFHVVGGARGFILRDSRVRDFNAQVKVNGERQGGEWLLPDDGRIERSEFFDSVPRQTSSPVTKLNINTVSGWVVRDSYIHDFRKAGGDGVSYGAFMKGGGEGGIFERNLVVCSTTGGSGGARIGLSFGGGGTAPEFCAPAFDSGVLCSVEHRRGVMRNNIVASCSDVGVYLRHSAETRLLFNTLVDTTGIDFRYETTSGIAHGNLMSGRIRDRDGASHEEASNLAHVDLATFEGWYVDPALGDLRVEGDVTSSVGRTERLDVGGDYCGRARPALTTIGALEHGSGDCATVPPPAMRRGGGGAGGQGGEGGSEGEGGSPGGIGGADGGGPGSGGGAGGSGEDPGDATFDRDGCSCASSGSSLDRSLLVSLLAVALLRLRRRG